MTICRRCQTTELSRADELVNKYAARTLKVPCSACRRDVIREYAKTKGNIMDSPPDSYEEYLAVPFSMRR